jgi:hypothetical protein
MDAPDGRELAGIVFGTSGRLPRVPFTDAVKQVQDQMGGIRGLFVVRFDFLVLNSIGNRFYKLFVAIDLEEFLKALILSSSSSSLGECSCGVVHRRHYFWTAYSAVRPRLS